jgi:LemA protein
VFAVAENYPSLMAIESFTLLQRSLNEVEEQLAASRRAFNAAVTEYNNGCEMWPTSIVASMMGYKIRPWFEATEDERKPVKVWGN